jgi:hypothetical protein
MVRLTDYGITVGYGYLNRVQNTKIVEKRVTNILQTILNSFKYKYLQV